MEKIAAEMDIVGKHEFQHFDIYFGEEVPKRNETIKQHLKNNLWSLNFFLFQVDGHSNFS